MTGITPSAENFRMEMARHRLGREDVCELIGLNMNLLSMYINEGRAMPAWAAHNIAYAINRTTGIRIFDVEMDRGVLSPPRQHRPGLVDPRKTVRLPVPSRRRRRRRTPA